MGSNCERLWEVFKGLGHVAAGSWSMAWLVVKKKMCCVLHVFRGLSGSLRVFRGLWDTKSNKVYRK